MKARTAFAATVAIILLIAVDASAQNFNPRYGVVTNILGSTHAERANDLGTGWVRVTFDWDQVEASNNSWNDSYVTSILDEARAHGLKVFATLSTAPAWAASCHWCAPYSLSEWDEYVTRVMNLWNNSYTDVEIVFGIGNEPKGNMSSLQYAGMFQHADSVRDGINSSARLAGPEITTDVSDFDAYVGAIGSTFEPQDVISVHWYPGGDSFDDLMNEANSKATTLNNTYSLRLEVWLTEVSSDNCSDTTYTSTMSSVISAFDTTSYANWRKTFWYVLQEGGGCNRLIDGSWNNRGPFDWYSDHIDSHTYYGVPVSLSADDGHYVVAEGGGGGVVNANRSSIGAWETFTLIDLNGGSLEDGDPVAFQTTTSGLFLQAANGGGGTMVASGQTASTWETFTLVDLDHPSGLVQDGDAIALQSSDGHYVVAESGGNDVVNANRTSIGAWETFHLICD
jgi:hypothetical protein